MYTVSKNIKRLRLSKNMTQDQLAEKMFVTRQTISNWEMEKSRPDIESLHKLAEIFGTDIDELIYGAPRGSYMRYQKRYVAAVFLLLIPIVIAVLSKWAFIPAIIRNMPDVSPSLAYIVPILLQALIFMCLGALMMSLLSLWFDCSIKEGNLCWVSAAVLLVPVLLAAAGYVLQAVTGVPHTRLLREILVHDYLRVILVFILPFASGILLFLFFNRKKA